jgi:hypothetical protein
MPRVKGDIPNLVNGISQQAAPLRLPSQAELQENFSASLLDGLTPRNNTSALAKLFTSIPSNAFTHIILRDETEKYVVVVTTTHFKVYDFAGNEKTVTNNSGTYLSGLTNPREQLRALTVADHTFIVNRTKVVANGSTVEPTRPHECLINVMAGNYGKVYSIDVNGVRATEMLTQDGSAASHSNYIDTKFIADILYQWSPASSGYASFQTVPLDVSTPVGTGGLIGAGLNTSPWAVGRYSNVIYLRNNTTDFTIAVGDGYNNRAMKVLKGRVENFGDLPVRAPNGFVIEVQGDESASSDNYWVKFQSESDLKTGLWKECAKPGTTLDLNATTMPHLLRRETNGTFTLAPATWDQRVCGDAELAPPPSFVGQTIQDVFFHRNRLGILTEENVVMSEAGSFFNFFRTTLTAILDTDPIDVAASHTRVSLLKHATPFMDQLILFSELTQFKLAGNELLTPKTVNIRPVSEIPTHPEVPPALSGTSLFFGTERTAWAAFYEYYLDKQLESADYDEVTAHVPAYIPSGIQRMVASTDLDTVIVTTSGDPTAFYVYKYFYNGQEKLQSAWYRWTFPGVTRIHNVAWNKGCLLALTERSGDLYLEEIDFERRPAEDDGSINIRLDMAADIATGSYNAGTNRTTYTLPYPKPNNLVAITGDGGALPKGVKLTIVSSTSSTIVVSGNHSTQPIRVGIPYTCRYRFSTFFYRGEDGKKALTSGRLQVMGLILNYARTSSFKVEVTAEGRVKRTYPFTGLTVSDPNSVIGAIGSSTGKISIPIMSRNDRVVIDIVNDSWLPCAFSSGMWHGVWNPLTAEQ